MNFQQFNYLKILQGKTQNRFWVEFQGYLNNVVPDFIVKTLILAGFDNAMSLSELNEGDIDLIEKFAAEKCTHLVDLNIENGVFKFKPGHRKLLFNLSKKVNQFVEEKALNRKRNRNQLKQIQNEVEEIEILSTDEIDLLRTNLIQKLNATSQSLGLNILFTEKEIGAIDPYISHSRLAFKKPSYKCAVKCVSCVKVVPCTYNGHWQTSNLDNHLKKEAKKANSAEQDQLQSTIDTRADKELNKLLHATK